MRGRTKLGFIKTIHTIVWVIMAGAAAVALAFGVVGRFDATFWVCLGLIAGEVVVLALSGMRCPLTPIAARYTLNRAPNFDIYLPRWLAEHNIRIFTGLAALGLLAGIVAHLLR